MIIPNNPQNPSNPQPPSLSNSLLTVPVAITGTLALLTQLTIVMWGLNVARPFLIPVLLAALVAFIVTPLVRALNRIGLSDTFAILITLVILAVPFLFVGYALVREIQTLIVDWPTIVNSVKAYLDQLAHNSWAIRLHLDDNLNLTSLQETFLNRAGEGVQFALVGLSALMDASSITFLIFMFAIFMIIIRQQLRRGAESLLASGHKTVIAATFIDEVSGLIQSFLVARFIITVVVAILASVILFVFHVKYALLLGGILGVATLIPNVGFIFGLIPPFMVGLAMGHALGSLALMFIVFLLLALFEANFLTPKLVGGKLNINSLAAFLGLFAGGLMWGVWGMLLSIPLLGIVRICLSLSPATRPWAELLAERDDRNLLQRLIKKVAEPAKTAVKS